MILHAARLFRREKGFVAVVVLTLAIGIGANAGLFAAAYCLLLDPLPFAQADRLVVLHESRAGRGSRDVSLPDVRDWQEQTTTFDSFGAGRRRTFGLHRNNNQLVVVKLGMVTAGYLPTLGISPAYGRTFTQPEETDHTQVIVLTDQLWTQRFNRNPSVVGEKVELNEQPYIVIGVLPSQFPALFAGEAIEGFIPLDDKLYSNRSAKTLYAIARIKPNSSIEGARTELQVVAGKLANLYPENSSIGADFESLQAAMYGSVRRPLLLLISGSVLILLIALTNVTFFFGERIVARMRELAIRMAVGATRRHLATQFMVEALMLCSVSAVIGIAIAKACLLGLPEIIGLWGSAGVAPILVIGDMHVDRVILAIALVFTLGLSLLLGGFCLRFIDARDLHDVLKTGNVTTSESRAGMYSRNFFVAGQIAISFVLLMGSGLLFRSFHLVLSAPRGFQSAGVVQFGLGLPDARYNSDAKLAAFHDGLIKNIEAVPGVDSVGGAWRLPTEGSNGLSTRFLLEGDALPKKDWPSVSLNVVTRGYFETLGIALFRGRTFSDHDRLDSPRVIVINHAFQNAVFKNADPLGKRLQVSWESDTTPPGTWLQIVGVVADTRERSLERQTQPEVYMPMSQFPSDGFQYAVRVRAMDPAIVQAMRSTVNRLDPLLETIQVTKLDDRILSSLAYRRFLLNVTEALALVGVLLMGIGLYGSISYSLAQGKKALAVRLAIGAQPSHIRALMLKQLVKLVSIGAVAGLLMWIIVGKLMTAELYGVKGMDLATLFAVIFTLYALCLCFSAKAIFMAGRTSPALALQST
jgi:putative ABC transport system permease protein